MMLMSTGRVIDSKAVYRHYIKPIWSRYNKFCGRHVILPADIAKLCPKNRLLSEAEWRQIGVQQSRGWEHYALHKWFPFIYRAAILKLTFCVAQAWAAYFTVPSSPWNGSCHWIGTGNQYQERKWKSTAATACALIKMIQIWSIEVWVFWQIN